MDTAWGAWDMPMAIEHRFFPTILYETGEIADIARCCTEHVRRACRTGALEAVQDGPRGHWLALGSDCSDWVRRGRPSRIQ